MYGSSFGGQSQGRMKATTTPVSDQNIPASPYDHDIRMSQTAQGSLYYSSEMVPRRPLQHLQCENPTLIGSIAQRQQQMMQSSRYHCVPDQNRMYEPEAAEPMECHQQQRHIPYSVQYGYEDGAMYSDLQYSEFVPLLTKSTPMRGPAVNSSYQPYQRPQQGPKLGSYGQRLAHPGAFPGAHPDVHPDVHPGAHRGAQPDGHRGAQPGVHTGAYPGAQPDSHPGAHRSAQLSAHPGAHPGAQPNTHRGPQPGAHLGDLPGVYPGAQPGAQSGAHQGAHPGGPQHGSQQTACDQLWGRPDQQAALPFKHERQQPGAPRKPAAPACAPPPQEPAPRPAAASSGSSGSPASFTIAPNKDKSSGKVQPVQERSLCVLTGSVDNIMSWGRKLDEETRPLVLFEIFGSLDSVARGQWHSSRLVTLRSLEGSATLSTVFWEMERPLLPPPTGSVVSCVCRLSPKWSQSAQQQQQRRLPRLQMLSVLRVVGAGQVAYLKRIAYTSGHAVQQGALEAPAAPAAPAATPSLKQTLISSYTAASPRSRE